METPLSSVQQSSECKRHSIMLLGIQVLYQEWVKDFKGQSLTECRLINLNACNKAWKINSHFKRL